MATLMGQTIVIAGGTSGIGFSVAKGALLTLAAHVIVASSTQTKVDDAVERLHAIIAENKLPGKVSGLVFDARDSKSIEALFSTVGEIDHLVWTSGDKGFVPGFKNVDIDAHKHMFDTRFWGPAVAAQKAKIRSGGSITLTIGQVVVRPIPDFSLISGISGAVDSMTKGLALDLAPIRVNVVSPGFVLTEFWKDTPPALTKQRREHAENRLLVKHAGTPDEVAEAYLFLMKCTYITGQRIGVDGGGTYV